MVRINNPSSGYSPHPFEGLDFPILRKKVRKTKCGKNRPVSTGEIISCPSARREPLGAVPAWKCFGEVQSMMFILPTAGHQNPFTRKAPKLPQEAF